MINRLLNWLDASTCNVMAVETIKKEWPLWIMAISFAGVLWSCYQYMNGLYDIHHMYACCKMLTWFGIMLLCTFDKKYLWKIWNPVYFVAALVWRNSYIKPYIGVKEQEELYKVRNDDFYKNTRERSSDVEGEKYITKGESDPKKLFLVIWLILILILTSVSLWLYSINNALV